MRVGGATRTTLRSVLESWNLGDRSDSVLDAAVRELRQTLGSARPDTVEEELEETWCFSSLQKVFFQYQELFQHSKGVFRAPGVFSASKVDFFQHPKGIFSSQVIADNDDGLDIVYGTGAGGVGAVREGNLKK